MLTVLAICVASYVAYRIGIRKGADEMYQLCRNAERTKQEFFSHVSLN
jgi:hypothetical protein